MFGDSHTQSFESHLNARSGWAVDYINHIGETPKCFADIIGEYYDIEIINEGKGGTSNYTIFENFLRTYQTIRPIDIVVFGWTSEGRFRIANEVNDFVDVTPFNPHPPQNDDVPKNVTDIISVNKVTYNIWWKEISDFIQIAKSVLPKNKNIFFYLNHPSLKL